MNFINDILTLIMSDGFRYKHAESVLVLYILAFGATRDRGLYGRTHWACEWST